MTFMLAKRLWPLVLAIAESCTGVSRDVGGGGGCIPMLCSSRVGRCCKRDEWLGLGWLSDPMVSEVAVEVVVK